MERESLRVLYLEDTYESYHTIREILESLQYIPLPQVKTFDEARAVLRDSKVDVLLVDLDLPETTDNLSLSAEFIREIRGTYPGLTILVHSARSYLRPHIAAQIMRSRVSYLIKDAVESEDHLRRAIEHARTGGTVYDRHVVNHFERIISETHSGPFGPRDIAIAEQVYLGKTNREIADVLTFSEGYVAERLRQMYRRLKIKSRVQLAQHYERELKGK